MESNENLFISSELRTLQQKVQYEKDSENVLKNVDKGNSEKGLLEKLKDSLPKIAEKVLAEKTSEKLFEKNKEKFLQEKFAEKILQEMKPSGWGSKRIAEKTSEKVLVEGIKDYPLIGGGIADIIKNEDSDDRLF